MNKKHTMLSLLLCGMIVLSLWPASPRALAEDVPSEPEAKRLSLTLTMPKKTEKVAGLLLDGREDTYVELPAGDTLTVAANEPMHVLALQWFSLPQKVTLTCYAGETKLDTFAADASFYNALVHVPQGTTTVTIQTERSTRAELAGISAYGDGALPVDLQQWEKPTQADVLLIVPFGGDEYRYFGGLIPTLIQEGVSWNVAYMGDYTRQRVGEVLAARWTMGLKTYPVFISCDTTHSLEYQYLKKLWGANAANRTLLNTFSALSIKVVVTCSADEQGEAAAQLTNELVAAAVKADKGQNVQKLYAHGTADGATVLTYTDCLPSFDGLSSTEIAQAA
ncbi:MAG: hypothetical protein IJ138_09580, partial [Clostridia bacterium]|nr:hypothetical protein [Clostridia bacterium]